MLLVRGEILPEHIGWRAQPIGLCDPSLVRTVATPNCGSPQGHIDVWSAMGNVIFDILPHSRLNPFIGAYLEQNMGK